MINVHVACLLFCVRVSESSTLSAVVQSFLLQRKKNKLGSIKRYRYTVGGSTTVVWVYTFYRCRRQAVIAEFNVTEFLQLIYLSAKVNIKKT